MSDDNSQYITFGTGEYQRTSSDGNWTLLAGSIFRRSYWYPNNSSARTKNSSSSNPYIRMSGSNSTSNVTNGRASCPMGSNFSLRCILLVCAVLLVTITSTPSIISYVIWSDHSTVFMADGGITDPCRT